LILFEILNIRTALVCVIDVARKQLLQQLPKVKSKAESAEVVQRLMTMEQEIRALVSSHNAQQKHGGVPTALMCLSCKTTHV